MVSLREFTCGNCGTEFATNCVVEDITCPECEAQRCPYCGVWFGEFGTVPGVPDNTAAREKAAVLLLEEALHLRQNGERAPGGNETWREWDRKTELFLRARLGDAAPGPALAEPPAPHPVLQVDPAGGWRDDLCRCGGRSQHIHCPWGGPHVHFVNDEGEKVGRA